MSLSDSEDLRELETNQQDYCKVYAMAIDHAVSRYDISNVQMDIEEAMSLHAIDAQQFHVLSELLENKLQEIVKAEFSVTARDLCPGGPNACKLGIDVKIDEKAQCAFLTTCRAQCAENLRETLSGDHAVLDPVAKEKRVRFSHMKTVNKIDLIQVS